MVRASWMNWSVLLAVVFFWLLPLRAEHGCNELAVRSVVSAYRSNLSRDASSYSIELNYRYLDAFDFTLVHKSDGWDPSGLRQSGGKSIRLRASSRDCRVQKATPIPRYSATDRDKVVRYVLEKYPSEARGFLVLGVPPTNLRDLRFLVVYAEARSVLAPRPGGGSQYFRVDASGRVYDEGRPQ